MSTRLRQLVIVGLIAAILLVTLTDTIARGRHTPLPGSMQRSRDAMATAITYVRYGLWNGYASYRLVNKALFDGGLSIPQEERRRLGLPGYVDVMLSPTLLRSALDAATSLPDPAAGGLYFMQDEKGLAILYILAFRLFGVEIESLFYLYMLLLSLTLLLTVVTFWARLEILLFFLVYVCAHHATALVIPEMPRQDINFIQGSRFLGVMAAVPMFHLMFLMLYRERPSPLTVGAACCQIALLVLLVNARNSVFWAVLAVYVVALAVWAFQLRRTNEQSVWRRIVAATAASRHAAWPLALLSIGVVVLALHQRYSLNEFYSSPDGQLGRVFWHNVTTALANHPERSTRLGIPSGMPSYDDQVGYLLFEREIERRGESRDAYLVGNGDWIYRTNLAGLDFRWGAYDPVLRDVVIRKVVEDPLYVIESLLVYQPLAAATIITSPSLLRWEYLLAPPIVVALLVGALAVGRGALRPLCLLLAWAAAFVAALGPLLVAAVVELRVVDVYFLVVFAVALLACLALAWAADALGSGVAIRSRRSQHRA